VNAAFLKRISALLLPILLIPCLARSGQPPLAISERGRGDPAIVLIHGLGEDGHLWDRVAPTLWQRHRLVIVDLPGHGRSAPLSSASVSAVSEALDRTLQDRKVKGALLVGHSYGGLVALEEAGAHPERAAGVVSIDLATYVPVDSEQIASLDQILTQRYTVFVDGIFRKMTRDSTQIDSVVAKAFRVPQPVLSDYFRNYWRTDLRPVIRQMKTPILVVVTANTWPPQESWASARERLGFETAGAAVGRRISNSGHLIPIDQPDTLVTAIEEFASGLKR
jgi:pimeloyl-ACP methyl ester carboxylesterase